MKIRSKLFLSFILLAGFTAILATFFAIYSISQEHEALALDDITTSRNNAENTFYEYLGELIKKAAFLSELGEVIENTKNPDELIIALENKSFYLYNLNVKIIDPELKIVMSYNNSTESIINQKNLKSLPFFKQQRDPLLRDTGIFKINNRISMVIISPIVDQRVFNFKAYLLFELYLNSEFADQLKDKIKSNIAIISSKEKLATSFLDGEGNRFFPEIKIKSGNAKQKLKVLDNNYLMDSFPISDYYKNTIGEIFVFKNINKILIAKKHGIRNFLFVLVIVFILVTIISIFIGKKITTPILTLSQRANDISKGKFNIKIDAMSNDEIGELSKIFNKMATSLSIQRDEIVDLKSFFEKIIENSPSAIFICNEMSNIVALNQAAEKLFSISSSRAIGKEIFEIIDLPPNLKADFYKVILSGKPTFHEARPIFLENNVEKTCRLTLYKIIQKKGISVAIQIEDITERLKMEEELTHARKLGTLGEVLSRFTHEFNNMMTGIIGHINLLKLKTNKEDSNYFRISSIEDLALKAHNLGENILNFSKKEKMETEKVDLLVLINSVLSLTEKSILKNVKIEKKLEKGSFNLNINKEKLSLAIFNILINAKDAIKQKKIRNGRIVIGLDWHISDDRKKKYIRLRINDNGHGIEDKNLERIFEPYFTTKGKKGTGIGLSTVKQFVEKNKGKIEVESEINKGTTFTLQFPFSREQLIS